MNESNTPARIYPLDMSAAEVIFAPLHDPLLAPGIGATWRGLCATRPSLEYAWCWTNVGWEDCAAGADAAELLVPCEIETGRFDRLIACVSVPRSVSVRLAVRAGETWHEVTPDTCGDDTRMEFLAPIPPGGALRGVKMTCRARHAGPCQFPVHWFGLADSDLVARIERARIPWDPRWPGLIMPPEKSDPERFAVGLLFGAEDLPRLRQKKSLPGWREHFAVLEETAARLMSRQPEDDLGEYTPWSDTRYLRARERGRTAYFNDAVVLAFVGIMNRDRTMLHHAARFLMCMVHTTHWCQSAESRLKGSTWDQRCFIEEMTSTAVALLADWLDFMLTDAARALIHQSLWDKGLSIIERDMMKYEYVYGINQGAWFCRARVLGGLLLERVWPRVGNYADRAADGLRECLDKYILADGGTDEGVSYWSVTLATSLHALLAYSRQRKIDARTLLPPQAARMEDYFATMSAAQPGRVLMDGDNTIDQVVGDAVPILAKLYPDSPYERAAGAHLAQARSSNYIRQYVFDGVFGFVFGPETLRPPEVIVPTFSQLPNVGQLTSFRRGRDGRSMRLHLSGSKANPSHSHHDKGAFTLELDGHDVLIDRGTVRYDDPRCEMMHRSYLHNVITPMRADGTFPDQASPTQPTVPQGQGDEHRLRAHVDLSNVWREHMQRCRRSIESDGVDAFRVTDAGELVAPGRIAFHLHAKRPFQIDGKAAMVELAGGGRLRISAPWASSIRAYEDFIDFRLEAVQHLMITSDVLCEFSLVTEFSRVPAEGNR